MWRKDFQLLYAVVWIWTSGQLKPDIWNPEVQVSHMDF